MIVLFETDKNIAGSEQFNAPFIAEITEGLKRFSDRITKVVAHVTDENAAKIGLNDKKCLLEARFEGKQPVVVTHRANTVQEAVTGALEKLKVSFEKLTHY